MNIFSNHRAPIPATKRSEILDRLRQTVAEISTFGEVFDENQPFRLGITRLDESLGGGLMRAALHECSPAAPIHLGSAAGFILALAVRAYGGKPLLWLQTDFAKHEAGSLHGPGFGFFGLPLQHLIIVRVRRQIEALWAMEEALKSRSTGAVIAELIDEPDLTTTRRLALAAHEGGGLGLLLRHRNSLEPTVATTRWEVSSAPGMRDAYGGLGATTFSLALTKNRHGPCGRWTLCWDHHACTFTPATFSLGVVQAVRDRSNRARLARAG